MHVVHRAASAAWQAPGPLTDEMLDDAIAAKLAETDDLDWKRATPPAAGLPTTDFPKDVAAMANSGGGVIVYGVDEENKLATSRLDIGEVTETYERSLRSAAVTAIHPPIFGLGVYRLGAEGNRALIVHVPASVDGPHLIYRNDYFGAPLRNDADTVWMRERQVEAMYRARFDERRNAYEALHSLYDEVAIARGESARVWMIGVARPRVPAVLAHRLTREDARNVLAPIGQTSERYTAGSWLGSFEGIDVYNPRPGLRRWIAPSLHDMARGWLEAWAGVHDNGSVTLAAAIGGHRTDTNEYAKGHEVRLELMELFAADLMTLVRAMAVYRGTADYELKVGLDWSGQELIIHQAPDRFSRTRSIKMQHAAFNAITTSVQPEVDDNAFLLQIRDLATDLVNQGGGQQIITLAQSLA